MKVVTWLGLDNVTEIVTSTGHWRLDCWDGCDSDHGHVMGGAESISNLHTSWMCLVCLLIGEVLCGLQDSSGSPGSVWF